MTIPSFDTFPDSARVWINAANRDLSTDEMQRAAASLSDFVGGWASHGRNVVADVVVLANRFVIIAAHIPGGDVSGCGIDASVHALEGIAETLGFEWATALDVFYRSGDRVTQVDRATFSMLARSGKVTPDTVVYDTSLSSLGELRSGGFELEARRSWHGRVFRFEAQAV